MAGWWHDNACLRSLHTTAINLRKTHVTNREHLRVRIQWGHPHVFRVQRFQHQDERYHPKTLVEGIKGPKKMILELHSFLLLIPDLLELHFYLPSTNLTLTLTPELTLDTNPSPFAGARFHSHTTYSCNSEPSGGDMSKVVEFRNRSELSLT